MLQIGVGREAALADLVDVEGKLRAYMLMLAQIVGNAGAVALAQLGKFNGHGRFTASEWPTESPT